MERSIELATRAGIAGEVPVGAIIVNSNGEIVAEGENRRERDRDPTAHAEIVAIRAAGAYLNNWHLDRCTLYVTLEPCPMCAGAIVQARMPVVVYGASDPKAGACHTLYQITDDARLNHRCQVVAGVESQRCAALLSGFFAKKRALGKK